MICDIPSEDDKDRDEAVDILVPAIGYDEYRRQFIIRLKRFLQYKCVKRDQRTNSFNWLTSLLWKKKKSKDEKCDGFRRRTLDTCRLVPLHKSIRRHKLATAIVFILHFVFKRDVVNE
uniref:Uncharacterized protein n=1 Tax=Glossina palpalis gambiensis TaxID=67801 RepID=A0A1B0BS95_9MUSC